MEIPRWAAISRRLGFKPLSHPLSRASISRPGGFPLRLPYLFCYYKQQRNLRATTSDRPMASVAGPATSSDGRRGLRAAAVQRVAVEGADHAVPAVAAAAAGDNNYADTHGNGARLHVLLHHKTLRPHPLGRAPLSPAEGVCPLKKTVEHATC